MAEPVIIQPLAQDAHLATVIATRIDSPDSQRKPGSRNAFASQNMRANSSASRTVSTSVSVGAGAEEIDEEKQGTCSPYTFQFMFCSF